MNEIADKQPAKIVCVQNKKITAMPEATNRTHDHVIAEIFKTRDRLSELQKESDAFTHLERIQKAEKYVGKYYVQTSYYGNKNDYEKFKTVIYVYGVDDNKCDTQSVKVAYYRDENEIIQSFSIEDYSLFNPERYDEDSNDWEEITKEQFLKEYNKISELLSSKINTAK